MNAFYGNVPVSFQALEINSCDHSSSFLIGVSGNKRIAHLTLR